MNNRYINPRTGFQYIIINEIVCVFKKDGRPVKTITKKELQDLIELRMVEAC